MSEEIKKSYLEQRVYDLCGLTPEQCSVPLYRGKEPARPALRKWKDKQTGEEKEQVILNKDGSIKAAPYPLFQSDKHDNIRMYPYTLDGQLITYIPDKQPKYGPEAGAHEEIYYVTRRHPDYLAEHKELPKYDFPKGEGHYPFFPPNIYEAFRKKEHMETIVLTEGYMKAMCASTRGMFVVGLGSITLYAESKSKQLYPDLVRLLNTCKPDNIVILYDGDCRDIKKEDIGAKENGKLKDLAKRPQIFKSVLLKLREMLLEFRTEKGDPCELYFAYVNKMRDLDPPKGLDDIIVDKEFKERTADIADDLNHPGRPGIYFRKLNLRTGLNKVDALFNLKSPQKFYEEWADEIGDKPFRFEGGQYQYGKDENGNGKLITLLDSSMDDYIAVGGEICLVTEEPIANANGTEWKLYPKPDKVINARLGDGAAKRLYQYKYYEDYTICPSHENYSQEVVNKKGYRFFNMYSPLPYEPEPGEWKTIEKLLKQITKEYPEEQFHYYEMLLDWITLTYIKPLQFLPIIMLVSKDRGTGKTSFLNLLKYIYGHNAVIGGNDLIVSKFNSLLAGKLIVGVDESCLGDNKEVGESLKYMSTSKTIHVEMKGKDKKEMPAFCKFVLASNEVRKGIFIAKDEIRFWVMRLSPWADKEYDSDFEDRIEGEVPAFLNYLKERYYKGKMYVPEKKHRMWFDPQSLVNEDLATMMSGTSSNFEGSLDDFLHDMFLDTGRITLHFDVPYILNTIDGAKKRGEHSIRILLDDKAGVKRISKSDRYSMPFRVTAEMKQSDTSITQEEGEIMWPSKKKVCRPYEFDAKFFLSQDEYAGLRSNNENEKKKSVEDTQQSIDMTEPDHSAGNEVDTY